MIIQCEKCLTRFRLDDSRVTDKGVKVRCTKCKHVFRVQKEEPESGSFEPGAALTGFSYPADAGEASAATPEDLHHAADSLPDAPVDSEAYEDAPLRSETDYFSPFETSSFDASSISFESNELDIAGSGNAPAERVEPDAQVGEIDFSSFGFGENDSEPDSTPISTLSVDDFTDTTIESAPAAPQKKVTQGLDFSDDDMFGAVVESAPEGSVESISFDFEGDSFAESMDMSRQDSSGKSGTLFSLDAPFSLSEIDFGDELTSVAVQQVNPDDLKPSQKILFAPLAEAQEKSADAELAQSFQQQESAGERQELPPLSIASRRKQSPVFAVVMSVIMLLVLSFLGYLGYSSFYTSKDGATQENGKISVRAVNATFVNNDEAGDLLVISGEAFNEYLKPRAALQVKVTVFDSVGQSIATKSAYGGNPLTEEQLKSLPLNKIGAAMANQFGDSLANMEVIPGKSIPFVVVLANLPKGAKDFAVQSVGSTVATGKQQ